ncbi:dicarboxylate/amino acid:cation symporter [Idiomarina xiamenensis]|uniref:Na+/H+-glutamate/aspartate symport protein n=1 Tax=Idiomarina xiamenensis 10-D-4 TaxID=740709 RepID=K2KN24_9GAMM|nr:dicarboxylate/amino acid:cation symporter [Idiomarina xiamenensis]EKE83864.1 Na+/H+ - glutamate/aspartate symport protein [Idiomarina xiamenensis 10-D-4]
MSNSKKKLSLTSRIIIGMVAGIIVGSILRYGIGEAQWVDEYLTNGLFHIIGQIFITSLKMLVVPLVFVSLVVGTCSLSDPSKLGRLGGKAVGMYLITTAIAISLAIAAAMFVKPGEGVERQADTTYSAAEAPSLVDVVIGLFPDNPIQAMAEGNMLQVIVFALLFGIAVALVGESGQRIKSFFEDINEVIMKLVVILMNLAPYGVFALMAKLFVETGLETIGNLAKYFVLVLVVLFVHALVTYPILLRLLARVSPMMFLRKMRDAQIFGFTTASSNATLPITLETVTKRMGVSNSVGSFTVPLGATINMDGTAIMQGVATVFIAQVYGLDLTVADYLMVILTATLASVGTAGVPGVGLIMLAMVLQQVGLPVEGIGLIIGVDRLLDMTRTAVNITGDSMVSMVVARSEGDLDEDVFNDKDAGKKLEEL